MSWTPSRVVLISRGRHDEAVASADCYPGMLLQRGSNGQVAPNASAGVGGELMVAEEDAWVGGDITQKLASGYVIPFRRPAKGDILTMLLKNGQNVANGVGLMSAGDGTLVAALSGKLYEIVAPSTVITNLGTETTFSNGSYTLPANSLSVGDVLHIRAQAFCVAENSTNTHRVRVYVGSNTLADSTALQLAANDYVLFDLYLTIRTITAAGTAVASGTLEYTLSATPTLKSIEDVSFTLDSTVAETFTVKSLASATSSGNQIRLDEFSIDMNRSGGLNVPVVAYEAIDNSGGAGSNPMSAFGSAAFIRVVVN